MGKSKKAPISLKKKTNPVNPIHIKEGEVLTDISGNNWKIGKSVGAGGFGEIYLVSDDIFKATPQDAQFAAKIEPHKNGPLFVEMNFYIRVAKKEMIEEWKRNRGLKHLGMPHYIAFGSHMYQNEKFRFLILKRFGQDLGKLLNKCKGKFHIKTVLTLGIKILDILEYIHSHGYIHADIKDSNLLLGTGKDDDNVYLLDYGLACRYVDGLGAHKEYNPDQRRAHDGTLQYTSRDAHVGAHSRRSDLEVLVYNMIHWLCGWLPWEEISDPEKVAQEKEKYMSNLLLFLKECFGDDPPVVISHFLKYVVSLNFETKPDYEYCKTLLRQGIRQAGYADDGKLNFNSAPAKLKSRKRIRNSDTENLVELKPVKIPRNVPRQPCVPVQANCNRMTRQQTAANTPALRSRDVFDWVKVLQSDPEKLLKSQNVSSDQVKKKKVRKIEKEKEKAKCLTVEVNLLKEKTDPLENPTPAMCEILKLRNGSAVYNTGRRTRSESHCSSPVFYDHSSLTPAMEEVIRRREAMQKNTDNEHFFTPIPATNTVRSNRLKNRQDNNKVESRKLSEIPEIKRVTRKTSVPETKTPDMSGARVRTRKYSLQEQKLVSEINLVASKRKNGKKESPKSKTTLRRSRRGLPTLPKSPNKKSLSYSRKRNIRRREVSPSEIDFVPRLRSGADTSEDYLMEKIFSSSIYSQKIRNYAANSGPSQNRRRRCGIDYSGLSPNHRDPTTIIL